ncbi:MAG TPA: superoxide dismutase [Candidatus Vogelbacteria bacterium]|uniref:Superoxide dismutase n=1 Tax=Candidatus Vogelbacteria bacterium RIFOXYD1_FULL_51_18 TaxID=1802440 RepID=A0A1G2QLC8_9BACT|nr:MAG: Superoxide dismutase [Parcubacteria group bacterium GW2011_GWC1_51_35]KKW26067.1 MAG: Superoxide dismutase [Parcubacteria group bacterium GW2011_GWF2_52_12]KKW26459.1 MAG: Superoxide dismutase [Parcubacteria group bacterium GW2011_GWF1_52_5]KKW34713.1 MAG: Superoxide dismutase [Parcubacteria group bacterium GW2011_GWB1_53_43]KKW38311.1 MAG: Superoxide dismutase [Parcubacteria group bacterium GW2011_GWA1_54_88]OHA60802.1 MAG: superoxide dismutase [Candidatus Vogelbacteria bacterium RIFO
MHTLLPLNYAYDALEPHIDARTMELHHTKHHQAYIDKLNAALEKYPEGAALSIEELLRNLKVAPEEVRTAVRNHGGGHANHSFFWTIIGPASTSGTPSVALVAALNSSFGSMEKFWEAWQSKALGLFGSGWVWLVKGGDGLSIITTANQDSSISEGKTPILALDVWEHAYYLSYQNRRADYVTAFKNVIQWDEVSRRFDLSMNSR